MDNLQKVRVLEFRRQHFSIYEISDVIGVSSQVVHNYLKTLRSDISCISRILSVNISDDQFNIFSRLIAEGRNKEYIARETGLSADEVETLVCFLTSRFNKSIVSDYYPLLACWLTRHNWSYKFLAEQLDCSHIYISKTLRGLSGTYPMNIQMAIKISKLTGLSLSEIYYVQMRNDDEFAAYIKSKEGGVNAKIIEE